jgi:ABC-type transport system involved in cytochrome bd biosynthesis fused ATPase/permease subunit
VDQLESYFGQYVPQFFYAFLAPILLFFLFGFSGSWRVAAVLLICVPLIPGAIIMVQKIAKKILAKYWGQYTQLGSTFLENLQGMTTLKTYQADEFKNLEMNREAELFRKVTMAVLTMQLNSIVIIDLVVYGGAALGILLAVKSFLRGGIGLARNAPFLLLDEPTSNLDSLNEAAILKSLKEASSGKTVVLVSHRKSTVHIADSVISMERGRLS